MAADQKSAAIDPFPPSESGWSPADSVTAIARRCGYLNLASFSRDFTAAYGRRPSELLRAHQA